MNLSFELTAYGSRNELHNNRGAFVKQYKAVMKQYKVFAKQYDAVMKQYRAFVKQYKDPMKQYEAFTKQYISQYLMVNR